MGGMAYSNENSMVFNYTLYHKSMNWTETPKITQISIPKTDDELAYYKAAKIIMLNCSLIPAVTRPTAKLVSVQMDLHYYISYMFSVTACDNDTACSDFLIQQFTTPKHVPTCVPPNINIQQVNSQSLRVTFDLLDMLCLHGELSYYGILLLEEKQYKKLVSANASFDEIISNATFGQTVETGEHDFTDLDEYWNHTVLVYAVNDVGRGAVSEPIHELTMEDGMYH